MPKLRVDSADCVLQVQDLRLKRLAAIMNHSAGIDSFLRTARQFVCVVQAERAAASAAADEEERVQLPQAEGDEDRAATFAAEMRDKARSRGQRLRAAGDITAGLNASGEAEAEAEPETRKRAKA
jgi:hypothetical protein